jgi:hypothetical protein
MQDPWADGINGIKGAIIKCGFKGQCQWPDWRCTFQEILMKPFFVNSLWQSDLLAAFYSLSLLNWMVR